MWDKKAKKIIKSRDVRFINEPAMDQARSTLDVDLLKPIPDILSDENENELQSIEKAREDSDDMEENSPRRISHANNSRNTQGARKAEDHSKRNTRAIKDNI